MKKQNCQHEWQILRMTNQEEKLMTGCDYIIKCRNCKRRGFIKESDKDWIVIKE